MEPMDPNTDASVQVMVDVIKKTGKIYPLTDKFLMSAGNVYAKISTEERVLFVDRVIEEFEDIVRQISPLKELPAEERLREMFEALDTLVAEYKHPETKCRKGCSACCYQRVAISEVEAEVLSKRISKEDIPALKKQAQAAHNSEVVYNKQLTRDEARCVFLKNGECSVYDVRPMMCRTYHAVSDPALCDIYDNPNSAVAVPHHQVVELVVSAIFYLSGKEGDMAGQILAHLEPGKN